MITPILVNQTWGVYNGDDNNISIMYTEYLSRSITSSIVYPNEDYRIKSTQRSLLERLVSRNNLNDNILDALSKHIHMYRNLPRPSLFQKILTYIFK